MNCENLISNWREIFLLSITKTKLPFKRVKIRKSTYEKGDEE